MEPTILIVVYSTVISVVLVSPRICLLASTIPFLDYTLTTVSVFGLSVLCFAPRCLFLFGGRLWFPVQGYRTIAEAGRIAQYLTMPSVAVGLQHVASITRYTRSMMLEVLGNNYIRTAHAKGLSERVVFYKHALKNALSPVVTTIGFSMASMLGGTVVAEMVFNIPGMGKLAYDSLIRRDYPQEQAIILFMTIVFVVVNIVMDIMYKWLDPRIGRLGSLAREDSGPRTRGGSLEIRLSRSQMPSFWLDGGFLSLVGFLFDNTMTIPRILHE